MSIDEDPPRPIVVGLGEVLWDVFPDGPRFGGAPANYACSVAALSSQVEVFIASRVGDDDLGRQVTQEFKRRNVNTSVLQTDSKRTGVVNVLVDQDGVASYEFAADTAWDNLQWTLPMQSLAGRTTAVCFGSLGQRSAESRAAILQFVGATPDDCLRIFDINLRPPFHSDDVIVESLKLANVLKLNDDELSVVARLSGESSAEESTDATLQRITQCWNLDTVALTCGADGAMLLHGGVVYDGSVVSTKVVDTVGAGDAFTAAMTLGLLDGRPPAEICARACRVAAFVCSQPGATPAIPDHLYS